MKDVVARAPVGLFGIVMGLAGLGTAWRTAHAVWGLPAAIGEVILGLAASVWLILLALYAMKWLSNRSAALAEFRHPVQSCIVAFVPMATMLIAIAARPYAASAALGLFVVGSAASLALAVCHTASLSKGARDPDAVTPALVLPVVGFCYVSAIAAGAFGITVLIRGSVGTGSATMASTSSSFPRGPRPATSSKAACSKQLSLSKSFSSRFRAAWPAS